MSLVKKDVKRNRTKRVDLKGLYAVPHEIAYANGKPRPEVYGVVTEYAKKLRLGKYEIIPHSMNRKHFRLYMPLPIYQSALSRPFHNNLKIVHNSFHSCKA